MNGPQNHREAARRYGVNRSTKPWMETVRLTMADQQSVFQYQLEKLHRMYKREVEQMEAIEAKVIGRSQRHLESIRKRVKKLKVELENETVNFSDLVEVKVRVSKDINAPATPETVNLDRGST
ncbi:hypothetical protein OSB04_005383 [Centaurea solstitialis]|uniref:Uncharacterized protein n=1 Tax=Centaurea solstitialis TaxID=347529 RepID=A0AA38TNJ6_9ASTR|nr:hypothetical protein OSB04_005383 [Centaurea solstitialis]